MAMMPDEVIDLLCEQEPEITSEDIRRFNRLYFSLLSTFRVKKCLYVQHYLLSRGDDGGYTPAADFIDLAAAEAASERYARDLPRKPRRARARLLADVARACVSRQAADLLLDTARLQRLFVDGMNLTRVPDRFLVLGFITACDPLNFDAQVARNCGKGELSADGGFEESGAVANVRREARFDAGARGARGCDNS
jgi:hypothetical protein